MKSFIRWIVMAGIGVILLIIGIVQSNATEVKCGSQVMKPGDSCTTTARRTRTKTTRSYTEQRDSDRTFGTVLTVIGSILILGGGAMTGVTIARNNKFKAAQAMGGGYPPAGGFPPPGPDGQYPPGGPQGQPGQPGFPQTGPQPQQGFPQTGPQGFPPGAPQPGFAPTGPQAQPGFPQTGPQPQPGYAPTGPQGQPGYPPQQPQWGQPQPGGYPPPGPQAPPAYQQPQPGQYPPGYQPPAPYQG